MSATTVTQAKWDPKSNTNWESKLKIHKSLKNFTLQVLRKVSWPVQRLKTAAVNEMKIVVAE